jgi:hypothetical protein
MEKYTNVTALPYLERLDEWYFNNDGIEKKFVFDNFIKADGVLWFRWVLSLKSKDIIQKYSMCNNKVNLINYS